ncbi:hypothetical protein XELAEV_18034859mg [Xenopus laevis]|uniref:Uncharacterized protein n=1 Tax=Xenopus laevis TaxID=8355 RepID=A0A974HBI2_XENLA|nr:hypothetical protein XELAEV_18034859mg [Xenopus laevis]
MPRTLLGFLPYILLDIVIFKKKDSRFLSSFYIEFSKDLYTNLQRQRNCPLSSTNISGIVGSLILADELCSRRHMSATCLTSTSPHSLFCGVGRKLILP